MPTIWWLGFFFSIFVKLVEKCLKKVFGYAKLAYEKRQSVFIETEGVLKSSPLTYELPEAPLTPGILSCDGSSVAGTTLNNQFNYENTNPEEKI